jgi:hypothetical protein
LADAFDEDKDKDADHKNRYNGKHQGKCVKGEHRQLPFCGE